MWHFVAAYAMWLGGAQLAATLARRLGARGVAVLGAALVGLALGVIASGAATAALTGYPRFLTY
jgi:hypothetical protein